MRRTILFPLAVAGCLCVIPLSRACAQQSAPTDSTPFTALGLSSMQRAQLHVLSAETRSRQRMVLARQRVGHPMSVADRRLLDGYARAHDEAVRAFLSDGQRAVLDAHVRAVEAAQRERGGRPGGRPAGGGSQ